MWTRSAVVRPIGARSFGSFGYGCSFSLPPLFAVSAYCTQSARAGVHTAPNRARYALTLDARGVCVCSTPETGYHLGGLWLYDHDRHTATTRQQPRNGLFSAVLRTFGVRVEQLPTQTAKGRKIGYFRAFLKSATDGHRYHLAGITGDGAGRGAMATTTTTDDHPHGDDDGRRRRATISPHRYGYKGGRNGHTHRRAGAYHIRLSKSWRRLGRLPMGGNDTRPALGLMAYFTSPKRRPPRGGVVTLRRPGCGR